MAVKSAWYAIIYQTFSYPNKTGFTYTIKLCTMPLQTIVLILSLMAFGVKPTIDEISL
jgi:hypothetical protein